MKQVIILNNKLKMSKNKCARVCHTAGLMSYKVSGFWQRVRWMAKGTKTAVLKTDNFEEEIGFLKLTNTKYYIHADAGAECMVTFFSKDDEPYFSNLKLY